jgi:hypothetical protein
MDQPDLIPQPRTVFWDVGDVPKALADLRGPGAFVPARVVAQVGERVHLSCRIPGYPRRIELIATVTGRRLPRGAGRQLGAGLVLRLAQEDLASARVLEDVASRRVVDLQQAAPKGWPQLSWSFDDQAELRSAVERLLDRERVLIPSTDAERGDRVSITADAPGVRLHFSGTARGVAMVNDERFTWVALAGDRDEDQLREQLVKVFDRPQEELWLVG